MDMTRIIKKCYGQPIFTNLITQMIQTNFLKDTNYQNSHKEKYNLNRAIPLKELIISNSPKRKALDPDGFTGEFYQIFKEELLLIHHNVYHETEAEGLFLTHSMKPGLPQCPTQKKTSTFYEHTKILDKYYQLKYNNF
jgi:hypothetical protein